MVVAWLINSMDPLFEKSLTFHPTARDVREAAKENYSDMENYSQIYKLNTRMWGTQKVTRCDYFITTSYWQFGRN